MVQTFGLTAMPAHDLYLNSSGNLVVLQGQQAVESACETISYVRLGECVLATTLGLPFFQAVWNGSPNIAVFENSLRMALMNVPGVVSIKNLSVNVQSGTLSYSVTIENVYGEAITLAQEIPA